MKTKDELEQKRDRLAEIFITDQIGDAPEHEVHRRIARTAFKWGWDLGLREKLAGYPKSNEVTQSNG